MKVLIVKPHEHPFVGDLPDLEAMQECVGGNIESVHAWPDLRAALVCDEDGLSHDSDWNRLICQGVYIKGTFFICGVGEEDFEDLPDELIARFSKELYAPHIFLQTPKGFFVMPDISVE